MYRFVVFCCLISLTQSANLNGRIVGGEEIDISEAPYQVSFQRHYAHHCGGALISKNIVLTAAHCIEPLSLIPNYVRIGSSNHKKGGVVVEVSSADRHPLYKPSGVDYDFAILKLYDYYSTGLTMGYAKLPEAEQDVADGTPLRITGWGTADYYIKYLNLRGVTVPKFNQEECKSAYTGNTVVTDRQICAGFKEGGADSCNGDSGGPLMDKDVIVGISSYGERCGLPNYPGVYARVSSVRDWIKAETGL